MGELVGGYSNSPYKDHDALQKKITSTVELARVGQLLKQPDEFFALIGINTKGFVQAICEVPLSILQQNDLVLHARLRNFARHSGVNSMFSVTDSDNLKHPQFIKAVEDGVLKDVVAISGDSAGQTLQQMGIFTNVAGNNEMGLLRKPRTTIKDDGLKVKRRGRSR